MKPTAIKITTLLAASTLLGATNLLLVQPTPETTAASRTTVRYAKTSFSKRLGSDYREERLYNHVPGSGYKIKSTSWKRVKLNKSKRVYVDRRARVTTRERDGDIDHDTYYRIRLSKSTNAKRYWVENDVFDD